MPAHNKGFCDMAGYNMGSALAHWSTYQATLTRTIATSQSPGRLATMRCDDQTRKY